MVLEDFFQFYFWKFIDAKVEFKTSSNGVFVGSSDVLCYNSVHLPARWKCRHFRTFKNVVIKKLTKKIIENLSHPEKNGHSLSAHVRFPRLSDVCVFVYQTISIKSNRIECWLCTTISTLNPKRVDSNFQTKSNIISNKHLLLNWTTTVVNCFASARLWLLTVLIGEREGKKNRYSYIV